jgi:cytochrome c553
MNTSMDQICTEYGDAELQLLADFLRRTAQAGRTATDELQRLKGQGLALGWFGFEAESGLA